MTTFAISGSNWIPLNPVYPHDQNAHYLNDEVQFDTGHRFSLANVLSGNKDVQANQKTLALLSKAQTTTNFLCASRTIDDKSLITNSTLRSLSGAYMNVRINDTVFVDLSGTIGDSATFTFGFVDDYVTLKNDSKLMTVNPTTSAIKFNTSIAGDADTAKTQQFKYDYSNGRIILFTNASAFGVNQKTIRYKPDTLQIVLGPELSGIPRVNESFNLGQFDGTFTYGLCDLSIWAKYFGDLSDVERTNFNVKLSDSYIGFKQNYLLTSPYETSFTVQSISSTNHPMSSYNQATFNLDFLNLKNVQTPEYELTETPNISSTGRLDNIKRREYDKLILGHNQDGGFINPYLSYTAETIKQVFVQDNDTYFHYPESATSLPLSAAGIIESGAIAGPSPWRSDKIFKKQAAYSLYSNWGNSSQAQDGTWLCTWLSGNSDSPGFSGTWVDRYYNPGYVTFTEAVSTYEAMFVGNQAVVYDELSPAIFDPGVLYRYYHVGKKMNATIVEALSTSNDLSLHYDQNWGESTQDLSRYDNDMEIKNFSDTNIRTVPIFKNKESVFDLHTQAYGFTPPADELFPTKKLGIGGWVYANNWLDVVGGQLFGNYYQGGYGIVSQSGLTTPLVTLYDTVSSHFIMLNSDGKVLKDKALNTFSSPSLSAVVVRDKDYFTWVFDNDPSNKVAHKIDIEGNIIKQITFPAAVSFSSAVVDKSNNVWFLDTANQTLSAITSEGDTLSGISVASDITVLDIDKNETIVLKNAESITIDNDNQTWMVFGTNLYDGEGNLVYHLAAPSSTEPIQITCDADNNLWALHANNKVLKMSNDGVVIFNETVTTNSGIVGRSINFTREVENGKYTDYAWINHASEQKLYKMSMAGKIVKTLDASTFLDIFSFPAVDTTILNMVGDGDFTGYQVLRKFDFLTSKNEDKKISARIDIARKSDTTDVTKVNLEYLASKLSRGWHHFFLSFDDDAGIAKFYVDGAEVDSQSFNANQYQVKYSFRNAFLLGATSGQISTLADNFKLKEDASFNGMLSDVRLYRGSISNFDVLHIVRMKTGFEDLVWNMPTGDQNYIEEIERFFKHQLPGQKSHLYNLKVMNSGISDPGLRAIIEDIIKDAAKNVTPLHTELYNIIWE